MNDAGSELTHLLKRECRARAIPIHREMYAICDESTHTIRSEMSVPVGNRQIWPTLCGANECSIEACGTRLPLSS